MPITVNLEVMLLALILKMPEIFQKKIAKVFFKLKIKIQELTNHINNLFIHESRMNKTSFMYKTLKNNTSQFISLAKDAGFKGTRNEGKVLFENI